MKKADENHKYFMKAEWENKKIRRQHFQTTGLPQDKERKERKKTHDNFQKLSRILGNLPNA